MTNNCDRKKAYRTSYYVFIDNCSGVEQLERLHSRNVVEYKTSKSPRPTIASSRNDTAEWNFRFKCANLSPPNEPLYPLPVISCTVFNYHECQQQGNRFLPAPPHVHKRFISSRTALTYHPPYRKYLYRNADPRVHHGA